MMVNAIILGHIEVDEEFCAEAENALAFECIDST